jgi:3-isopropylmalate/(R)-2-methylmalate dehydratase large subunit
MHAIQKILAKSSGNDYISPGETVVVNTDTLVIHDAAFPFVLEHFSKLETDRIWDPNKVVIVFDHYQPPISAEFADIERKIWEFAHRYEIRNVYPGGCGIEHQILPEMGHIWPGSVVFGSDTDMTAHGAFGAFSTGIGHTDVSSILALGQLWVRVPEVVKINLNGVLPKGVTAKDVALILIETLGDVANYKVVEFSGPVTKNLSMEGRSLLCNVVGIRLGAKSGYVEPDVKTISFLEERVQRPFELIRNDPKVEYSEEIKITCGNLEPSVMLPNTNSTRTVSEVAGTKITQAFIGTCIGGRLEDLQIVAKILEGRKVKKEIRLIIVPSSQEVYLRALKAGLISIFVNAGAMIGTPGCGPCFGHHSGVLGPEDICLSAGNRNNRGEMGHPDSLIFIASPPTVAASSIEGRITDPRKYL